MPALITHHLFGEDAVTRLPEGIIATEEELLAFLLANQGPDPLYARFGTRPSTAQTCRRLAHEMHDGHVVEALMAARDAAAHLPNDDKDIGRAFVLGLLAHYVLDSRTHPFVYAQQRALVAASPELAGREDDVHALIEGELDSWMLWSQRHLTVEDAPTPENLAHTDRTVEVGGAIFAQVAAQVFDTVIGAREYGGAVDDYQLIYAVIDPAGSTLSNLAIRLECAIRSRSQAAALAHRITTSDACAAANIECRPWTNPSTGERSDLGFGDLYFAALDEWPVFAEALVRGDADRLARLAGGVNYDGAPAGAARS